MKSKIIVALDGISRDKAMLLARSLSPYVYGFKVNSLLLKEGCSVIKDLKVYGTVMADPKLFDIPNTVCNAIEVLAEAGAGIVTVHSLNGPNCLEEAQRKARETNIVLAAVTVLTSVDTQNLQRTIMQPRHAMVPHLARMAQNLGYSTIVCGPEDLCLPIPIGLKRILPAIRLTSVLNDDQAQRATEIPSLVTKDDLFVVGRPIVQADDPVDMIQFLNHQVEKHFEYQLSPV